MIDVVLPEEPPFLSPRAARLLLRIVQSAATEGAATHGPAATDIDHLEVDDANNNVPRAS